VIVTAQERGSFVSLQLPKRAAGTYRWVATSAVLGTSLVLLSSCSSQTQGEWKRLAMPEPVSQQGEPILSLWQGAWIAALVTGVVVWALILYAVFAFRRRSDDEIPIQTRYNLPLEIFYTIAPIIMVIVFFSHTVDVQNAVLNDEKPDVTIEVVGQQWQWGFNYGVGDQSDSGMSDLSDDNYPYSRYVYDVGTGSHVPTLVLPVDETIQFNLHSPDVIHDFGIPAFLMRMDVIPGRVNHYQIKPTTIGDYRGKCYELCGVYHSRMTFWVKIVSQDDYAQYLQDLEARGQVSDTPLLGGSEANTQDGLEPAQSEGGSK
ncbi:MAG: cytochrome c oxidase, subunit, partial [Nocardioides sp.]|jgi:cytochrome c oxidase subunit 2|nr:cytochrome c oxidase, subunit [Nocardioides sp.]